MKERLLKPNQLAGALASVKLSILDRLQRQHEVEHAILLPHLIWAALWEAGPAVFERHMLPAGKQQTTAFWHSMQQHPALDGHPMLAVADWRETFIPLSLHGDGVPVTGCGKSWAAGIEV